ncbi:hypothetical protein ASZ78_012284 [Callipepla squamata]|uniref:Sulfatase N-terminal domain-containing protein n=1 Tax=Callipepla squamata TaxID=9009 RepID=A0A226NKF3_CALSU|nr:hypothetical protein ASZ78_012284 [Callipepla squamata]
MLAVGVLAGLSVLSLLTYGYLSWDSLGRGPGEAPAALGEEPGAGVPSSQPHIVFILADDQGFRDIGYHGSEIRTPTLDKLAAEGVKLENYYVQPMCTPSRSQFITGNYGPDLYCVTVVLSTTSHAVWIQLLLLHSKTELSPVIKELDFGFMFLVALFLSKNMDMMKKINYLQVIRGHQTQFKQATENMAIIGKNSEVEVIESGEVEFSKHIPEGLSWRFFQIFIFSVISEVSLLILMHKTKRKTSFRYQIHTGLQHSIIRPTQPNCLPLDNVTLPQKLKEVGYSTHMVGKWHLGFYRRECMPTQRGFDTFFGSLLGSGDYYTHFKCDSPGICGYDLYENDNAAWDHDNGIYSTQMYTQKVQQILASHDPRKPIFLYIAYQAVHSPLQAPGKYFEHYRSINNINRRRYAAMLACLDEAINNVTLALKKYGYYDNSIIIYSSDNGGQPMAGGSNWPLRGSKGTYWEGGIRAVGFVHSPLLKNKGSVCKELVHITDWFPTLITLAEGQIDEDIQLDGYDIWETISEGRRSPRVDILHNIDPIYTKAKNGSWAAGYGIWNTAIQSAIRVNHWKLLTGNPGYSDWVPPQAFSNMGPNRWHNERVSWSAGKTVWLFNITADPYERVDLSAKYPDVVKQLLRRLSQFNKTAVPVRYPPKDPRSNPKLNGGVWGPWFKEDEKKKSDKSKSTNKQKKNKNKKKASRKKGQSLHCRSRLAGG